MASHPTLNYFAAGYDNGMCVFKLEKERHASVRVGSAIFYVKAANLYMFNIQTVKQNVLQPITINGKAVMLNQPSHIYYNTFNQSSHDILTTFDIEGG